MEKEKLVQLLDNLGNSAIINAQFSFDRPYTSVYKANITGVNFEIGDDGSLSAVICIRETPKPTAETAA